MKSIKEFIKIVNDIFSSHNANIDHSRSFNDCEIKEILLKALSNFINDLTYEEKMNLSSDIFNKFQENRDFEKVKKAKTFFTVYAKKLKSLRKIYFEKWKRHSCFIPSLINSKIQKRNKLKSNLE